jgi:hypothetical protein
MTEAAQRLVERRSRLQLVWDALRRREQTAAPPIDASVSFAELVWAHHERQKEVYDGVRDGPWEQEYRRRLNLFKAKNGELFESYWCRHEASGVVLTEKRVPRRLSNFFRRESILRLHTATDWRTANAPDLASALHKWETAGIKASEILRDSSERIALHRIFAASSRLLGFADAKAEDNAALDKVVKEQDAELADVTDYYVRAGQNSARIVYFRGMVWGAGLLAGLVGGSFLAAWGLGWLDPHREPTYTLFVCIAMGAGGAILSVMTRMAKPDSFNLEFEVGRKAIRRLGGLRPWIGALLALVLYLALKSNLVELFQSSTKGIYFYATIAFLAGFSERRAKILLDSAVGGSSPGADDDTK